MSKKSFKKIYMLCPFCESDEFIRRTSDRIKIADRGTSLFDETVQEGDSTITCANCANDFTDEELKRK